MRCVSHESQVTNPLFFKGRWTDRCRLKNLKIAKMGNPFYGLYATLARPQKPAEICCLLSSTAIFRALLLQVQYSIMDWNEELEKLAASIRCLPVGTIMTSALIKMTRHLFTTQTRRTKFLNFLYRMYGRGIIPQYSKMRHPNHQKHNTPAHNILGSALFHKRSDPLLPAEVRLLIPILTQ